MTRQNPRTGNNGIRPCVYNSKEIRKKIRSWIDAWNRHDLDEVMAWFHDDTEFIHWDGNYIRGKSILNKIWKIWFQNHGNFRFDIQDIIVDTESRKASFSWILHWPSREPGFEGEKESREGVDILHFQEGKIISKQTFTKTSLLIDGKKIWMHTCK
ncbi:MAG: nuclear transport factor 2 family protein [Bacteroidales bacterium]|nr:nuclear transport factor 2 family protein [Bacteroidales bacterium]